MFLVNWFSAFPKCRDYKSELRPTVFLLARILMTGATVISCLPLKTRMSVRLGKDQN